MSKPNSPVDAMAAKLLVVEDEVLIGMVIADILEGAGHVVLGPALSGAEAVAIARETPPDLVLSDIRLQQPPDGIDTARLLLAEHDCGVIFVTGQADETSRRRADALSPLGFILKPFAPETLLARVEYALATLAARRAPEGEAD